MKLPSLSIWFIFILLAIILVVVNAQQGCQSQECLTNDDCIKVQITCCPCNMGGTEQCVPRSMASVYEERLKNCPPQNELVCTALYNCQIEKCTCINGKCGPE